MKNKGYGQYLSEAYDRLNADVNPALWASFCEECFEKYGVDGIMIGRASFGRPWIFKEVKHYLETGEELPPLSFDWKMATLRQQVLDSVELLDERRGILHVRRHLANSPMFKGIPNFKETRIAMLRAETVKDLFSILDYIKGNYAI